MSHLRVNGVYYTELGRRIAMNDCINGMREDVKTLKRLNATMQQQLATPRCRCGQPCQKYGSVGGWSKACEGCNRRKARLARESRARMKRRNK